MCVYVGWFRKIEAATKIILCVRCLTRGKSIVFSEYLVRIRIRLIVIVSPFLFLTFGNFSITRINCFLSYWGVKAQITQISSWVTSPMSSVAVVKTFRVTVALMPENRLTTQK